MSSKEFTTGALDQAATFEVLPHKRCRRTSPRRKVCAATMLACVAGLAVAGCGEQPDASGCPGPKAAFKSLQASIEEQLKSPSTAEFPPEGVDMLIRDDREPCTYRFAGVGVDSQNGFGAITRSTWVGNLKWDPTTDSFKAEVYD